MKCDFCDLSIPHIQGIPHYHGIPICEINDTSVFFDSRDPRKPKTTIFYNIPSTCKLEFQFELEVKDGTRFPVLIGETTINKPCTLVVVKNGEVYGNNRIAMLTGDIVEVSTDEENKYGSIIIPMVDNSLKIVSVSFVNKPELKYSILIMPGGFVSSNATMIEGK